jgi:hypothetical protein
VSVHAAVVIGAVLVALASHATPSEPELVLSLTPGDIARIRPGNETPFESFDRDWGQFEVLVPKDRFPIPAPNCRRNVILRMPAVDPDASDREHRIEQRWQMFRSLHELTRNHIDGVQTRLARGPYMEIDDDGKPVLEYCNAYFAKDFLDP